MSNLGRYQEFTTQAKAAGGVDALIKNIEHAAMLKAAVPLLIIGGGIGWVATKVQARAARSKAALRENQST